MDGCNEYTSFKRRDLLRHAAQRQVEQVAVPAELLESGAERFFSRQYSRRTVLGRGGGLVVSMALATQLRGLGLLERAAAAANPTAPILVTIYLGGGNDGLNTLVPRTGQQRSLYDGYRRRIGIPAGDLLTIGDHPELGWHPRAAGFKQLYDAGKLAVFTGVDYPDPTMSHFESEQYFRTGSTDNRVRHGWLGRYLDIVGTGNPLEGIAVQWGGDGALLGRRAATCAVHDPGDYTFWSPGVWDSERMMNSWSRLGGTPKSAAYRSARKAVDSTYGTYTALRPLAAQQEDSLPAPPVAYPADYGLGQELRTLGRLLGAGLGTRVATLHDSQGYDTHDDQPDQHGQNLANLSAALVAWQADLASRGLERRVVTMVWSEFGRRAEDNDGDGTDHGAGGLLMVINPDVRPGIRGDGWHLDHLDDYGNLAVTTDFRDVYAGVLEGHLNIGARDVLPGYAGAPLTLMAS